jgi:general stress protein 26
VGELIKNIKLAMMTTVDADGTLHSRPMATQEKEFDGTLYFLTGKTSHKIQELDHDTHINLAYANPDRNHWVSVAGKASVSRDQNKIDELWSPFHEAWFPEGKEDPNIAVLRVEADSVEYWEAGRQQNGASRGPREVTGNGCSLSPRRK